MKKIILFLTLGFLASTCFGQGLPCTPIGSTVIGQPTFTPDNLVPPSYPLNPREKPLHPNDRLVVFLHGLGGNNDTWAKVAQATQYQAPGQSVPGYPHRKVTSLPLSYSQFSLSGAASTFHNALVSSGDPLCVANGITDKTINFIVAHSQGGIVARSTDKMYDDLGMQGDRRFGGIVTFGTPHGGAAIINNKDEFIPFSEEACKALLAGPAEELLQDKPIIDFFVSNETFKSIQDKLCNILGDHITPIAFKDQFQEITEDYKVGAAALGELNNHNSTIPRVALYGVETEPVFYRTVYNLKVKTPNQFPHFEADNDQELVDRFNNLLNKYKNEREINQMEIEFLESIGIPCGPLRWICCNGECAEYGSLYKKATKKRDAWWDGELWLSNSNTQFKSIIGASTTTWVPTYLCTCSSYTYPSSIPSCQPGCTLSSNGGSYVVTEKPCDGIVLAESAMAYPGAQVDIMPGSNHQQMRNDSNTKTKMLKLLEGGFGNYFKTSVR